MVMERDCEHIIAYTDVYYKVGHLNLYNVSLTNVVPINLIKSKIKEISARPREGENHL